MPLIHFELCRLSDAMLAMMLETTLEEEKQTTNSTLLRTMQTALADEELRRVALKAGKPTNPVRLILPFMDADETASALGNLAKETIAFETAAVGAEDKDPTLCAEYRTAAEFCCAVGMALREQWRGMALAQSGIPN